MKISSHSFKLLLALCLSLTMVHCDCSSDSTQSDEETDENASTASESACIVSTQYTTGQKVTTAFSETDFDGDCVLDDGDVSGLTNDHICTGGERTDCDDNCSDVYNILQEDSDSDGVGDYCDNCADVANTDQADNDIDGMGDGCDDQSDHDSIPDETDNCPLVTNEDQADADGDGIGDACEETTEPEEPACDNSCDLDHDGMGNDCDDDDDGDAVTDTYDVCPLSSSVVDCSSADDSDGDGVVNTQDNCPSVSNACQTDADGDGMGIECDTNDEELPDDDGDGVLNSEDNCPSISDENQNDSDYDGIGDVCDSETCDDTHDNDGNGKTDCSDESCAEEDFCDYDEDGLPADLDLCPTHADPWWLVPYLWDTSDVNGTEDGDSIMDLQETLAACDLFHSMACTFVEQDLWGLTEEQLYKAENAYDDSGIYGIPMETFIEAELEEQMDGDDEWHMFDGTIQYDVDEDGIGDECDTGSLNYVPAEPYFTPHSP